MTQTTPVLRPTRDLDRDTRPAPHAALEDLAIPSVERVVETVRKHVR